jgi:hypothetical protein
MISHKLFRAFRVRQNLMNASAMVDNAATQAPKPSAVPSANVDSLDVWIDSLRSQHNIPAMAAVVMRADTILARGVAGVRHAGVAGAASRGATLSSFEPRLSSGYILRRHHFRGFALSRLIIGRKYPPKSTILCGD